MSKERDPDIPSAGGKTSGARRPWRHPSNPSIELPYPSAAAVALMAAGISDYSVIAIAVGLTVEEVRQIDTAEDPLIRQLAIEGIPEGQFFKLVKGVRCPRCGMWITIAPCAACSRPVSE